jgi:hypothetical protein
MTRTTARQFGRLIETGGAINVMYGYLLGAALMVVAGVVEIFLGVEAAQKQLEDIAKPLTAEDAEAREDGAEGEGDLDVEQVHGEKAAPIDGGGDGRFERDGDDIPAERTRSAGGER